MAGGEQFDAEKGLVNEPQRCPSRRAVPEQNRALGIGNGGGGGQREMHAAVCFRSCGGQALVPFLPRNDRPVYCSSCFDKVRATRAWQLGSHHRNDRAPQPRRSFSERQTIAIAQCLPYGQRLTYWPMRAVLLSILELADDTGPDALRDALRDWLAAAGDAEATKTAEQLAATFGAAESEVGDRIALFGAWSRFIELAAEREPLVLVIEDLHWSSDSLLDLIEAILQPHADVPLLMIALARPELLDRRPTWGGGRRNAVSIALEPLADASIAELVADLLESPATGLSRPSWIGPTAIRSMPARSCARCSSAWGPTPAPRPWELPSPPCRTPSTPRSWRGSMRSNPQRDGRSSLGPCSAGRSKRLRSPISTRRYRRTR